MVVLALLILNGCSSFQLESNYDNCQKVCHKNYTDAIKEDSKGSNITGWVNQYDETFNIYQQCNEECGWAK